MNRERIERIANAVLYEGYLLYPYRLSSVKNQRRFNFGVLIPPAYGALQSGAETSEMRTDCLVRGGDVRLMVVIRFLQVTGEEGGCLKAIERDVTIPECSVERLQIDMRRERFTFQEGGGEIRGEVEMDARRTGEQIYRLSVRVRNCTPLANAEQLSRDEVLPSSLVSAHTLLFARDGEFISLLDPPEECREATAKCENVGTWPVLAGAPGERDAMLSSPIILYDYPQVAAESPGDLFDGLEIDEILSLRILTMTDQEKAEMRAGDDRARQILERTEHLSDEHLMKLHGVLRGLRPVGELQ